jgi:hypothetical protein
MGIRIDCSNPVRKFPLTPEMNSGRIIDWTGKFITGRYYTIWVSATVDMSTGAPLLWITIQRDLTIEESADITDARAVEQITFADVAPEIFKKAQDVFPDHIPAIKTIQRRLMIPYHTARNVAHQLELSKAG